MISGSAKVSIRHQQKLNEKKKRGNLPVTACLSGVNWVFDLKLKSPRARDKARWPIPSNELTIFFFVFVLFFIYHSHAHSVRTLLRF